MPSKPKTEFRVVCANHGTAGHSSHVWLKKDMKKAEQSVIDAAHRAEMNPTAFYSNEVPYIIETREVGQWEAV